MEANRLFQPFNWDSKSKEQLDEIVNADIARLGKARKYQAGYPLPNQFRDQIYSVLLTYHLNHVGDPELGGQYAINVLDRENEVVDIYKRIWGGRNFMDQLWGYISTGGTENNLWAVHTGVQVQLEKHAGRKPVIICSREAHYSIDKAARMTRLDLIKVCTCDDGSVNIQALETTLSQHGSVPIILVLTCGTTMKEGHDDIAAALNLIKATGRRRTDFFIVVDGALSGTFLPSVNAPLNITPGFWHDIDVLSTSGHKFVGAPIPCGILVMKKIHKKTITRSIEYIRSYDSTMSGSRSGFVAYCLWLRLYSLGSDGIRDTALSGIELASVIAKQLRDAGIDAHHNPFALTVVFPKPSPALVDKYSLACEGNQAHIVLTPNTLGDGMERFFSATSFVHEYLNWYGKKVTPTAD